MITDLEREMLGLAPGTHACLLHWGDEERRSAVEAFLRDGLAVGDRCKLVVHEPPTRALADLDRLAGLAGSISAGDISLGTAAETYLPDGRFDPEATMALLDDEISSAPALGFPLLRATGEMTWAVDTGEGDRLLEYEAALNDRFAHRPVLFLCQYDCRRFPAGTVLPILLAHPVVVARGHVYRNTFFKAPESVPDTPDAAERVEWILDELEAGRQAGTGSPAGGA